MLFDWFTLVAQVLNFLILMWLLKHFLYKPVLDAIDAREQRISDLLRETKASQQQAAEQQAQLTQKNDAFESEKTVLFEQVKVKAETQRKELLDKAAKEVAGQREQWLSALQSEQHTLDKTIVERTRSEVLNLARQALTDLSGAELEIQIVKVLIKRIETMTPEQREQFKQTAAGPQNSIVIRSAFEFSAEQQDSLSTSVHKLLPGQPSLSFKTDTDLIGGVELVGNGHKLSWNIAAYLSDIDQSIKRLVDNKLRFSAEQQHDKA